MPIERLTSTTDLIVSTTLASAQPPVGPIVITLAQAQAEAQATTEQMAIEGDPIALASLARDFGGLAATLLTSAPSEPGKGSLLDVYD